VVNEAPGARNYASECGRDRSIVKTKPEPGRSGIVEIRQLPARRQEASGDDSTANEDATTSVNVGSPGFIGPSLAPSRSRHPHLLLDERHVFARVLLLLLDRLLFLGRVLSLLLVLLGRLMRHRVLLLIAPEKRNGLCSQAIGSDVCRGSECRGRSMVKTHPKPGRSWTLRTPWFASTLRRQIANPSPRPDLSPPHWVNGRNILSAPPAGRPPQQSSTSIRMRSAAA